MDIRNEKVWKHGPYCWYFRLNLKYLGWPYREYIITAINGGYWEELFYENYFEAVLATFCCCDHGANASEAIQEIATDQKVYHKCSSYNIVFWIAKIYQSITVKKDWLLGHLRRSIVAKKLQKLHRKKSNNWPMVKFITTWMGYSFKTKCTKSKATFLR